MDVWNKGWKAADVEARRASGIRNVLAVPENQYPGYLEDTISKEYLQ
jgi:hypothetical protein